AAGFPEDGPPAPVRPWGRTLAARTEDWAWLRSAGVAVAVAAGRVGVSWRGRWQQRGRIMPQQPDPIDHWFPRLGPCGICGTPGADQRHRVIEAIADAV